MIRGAFQTSVSEGEPDWPSRAPYVADVPLPDIVDGRLQCLRAPDRLRQFLNYMHGARVEFDELVGGFCRGSCGRAIAARAKIITDCSYACGAPRIGH
jgi:hypothetical protein